MERMKVSPIGVVVVHKPDPYPSTPWVTIHGPKPTLFRDGGLKVFYTDAETENWPNLVPDKEF